MHMIDGGGIGSLVTSTKLFAKAAAEGSFSVSETGGQALLTAIQEMRDWINDREHDLTQLRQQPPLGSSHGAETMKPYVADVAGDQRGFITMLLEFRASLDAAEQGINAAMASYQDTEVGISSGFTQV